jgi:hypothetical protein
MDVATEVDRRLAGDTQWSGYLTRANIVQVADRIRRLLTGKRYVFVVANEFMMLTHGHIDEGPEVRIEQLSGNDPVTVSVDGAWARFMVHDTYGIWGSDTDAVNRAGVSEILAEGNEGNYPPYILFRPDRVEIRHRAPAGHVLVWTAMVCGDVDPNFS